MLKSILKRIGSKLTNGEIVYIISTRSNPTAKKPPLYLIQKKPVERYVSSLYAYSTSSSIDGVTTYKFDDRGVKYLLHLGAETALIEGVLQNVQV